LNEVEVQDHVADYYVEKRYKGLGLKYHFKVINEMMEGIDGKILDMGCGTGIISDLYPERDILGIDSKESSWPSLLAG
jgi:2-polyprenyl-3-methyl-5-hydroxy-6-metoxy-1,4-benzoquinol methylase